MKPTEEIIEKIRKCLNLATGLNATQGEMEAAMGKAKEIALRHNIELGSINLDVDSQGAAAINIERDSSLRTRSQYQQPYHRWIFQVLEKVFEVKVILSSHSSYGGKVVSAIHLIGETTDVAIAKVMFAWLERLYPQYPEQGCLSGPAHLLCGTHQRMLPGHYNRASRR